MPIVKRLAIALAVMFIPASAAFAKMDFPAAQFGAVLDDTLASLWPKNTITLAREECTDAYCGYTLGGNILLRAYAGPGDHVHELSAVLEAGAAEMEHSAFRGMCVLLLNIADAGIAEDTAGDLADELAYTAESETRIAHGRLELVGLNEPDKRVCAIREGERE